MLIAMRPEDYFDLQERRRTIGYLILIAAIILFALWIYGVWPF
jgi:hypothetical protein